MHCSSRFIEIDDSLLPNITEQKDQKEGMAAFAEKRVPNFKHE
jgi:hypothetical protein